MRASPHRQTIAKLFNDGISTGDIARRLLLPRATVYRVVQQLKDRGHVLELKKSGRPRTVNTRRTRGIIKKRITRNDAVSMNQMASSLGIPRQSVQSIVKKDLGLNSYRLLRGQYLTEQSKKNRLEKAKKLLDALKVRRLSEVIWTDEKIFTVEPLPNRQNARQLLSKDEAKSPKRRLAYKRLFPKSVMVWAGLTSEGKVPLVFIDRNVKINSDVYQKLVLMDVLRPWVTSHFGQQPFILQQDWAPSHGSKSTKAVLDAHFPGYWGKDMWPASSPDLNPLDFSVWGYLEEKVMARPHPNVDSLKAALLKAWDDLDDDYLRRTVASVPAV
ncbi:Protein CBG27172 [Caenorhabditis briggsae]|uniref:Protein CBG27172 n=1 Tax=Caenorhabditis briggsae TaxID=6238 RepID=B6IL81_CAEBR|nr:Protein CBG27172 [Caenorhabditis briggsae]CAS00634.1 Protein CBG27172 [Caenorhabditis briggsae]